MQKLREQLSVSQNAEATSVVLDEQEFNRPANESVLTIDVDDEAKKEEVEIDMSDDIEALISGEDDLSEEFQNKAKVVFEAAVSAKVKEVQEHR